MKYDDELQQTLLEFPEFRVELKRESGFMRVLNVLLLIVTFGQQRSFMVDFITTIGHHMWVPDDWEKCPDEWRALFLRHERVHLRQQRRLGMTVYALTYLLWPVPFFWANGRTKLEMEAYAESLRARYEYFGGKALRDPRLREHVVRTFTGSSYGWMWVGRKRIERWYDDTVRRLLNR